MQYERAVGRRIDRQIGRLVYIRKAGSRLISQKKEGVQDLEIDAGNNIFFTLGLRDGPAG